MLYSYALSNRCNFFNMFTASQRFRRLQREHMDLCRKARNADSDDSEQRNRRLHLETTRRCRSLTASVVCMVADRPLLKLAMSLSLHISLFYLPHRPLLSIFISPRYFLSHFNICFFTFHLCTFLANLSSWRV